MLGTIVNTIAILIGGIVGLLFKNGISERYSTTIMNSLSLCVIFIGISGSLKCDNVLLLIISLVIGAFLGEFLDIDAALKKLGDTLEKRFTGRWGKISDGFVTASLLFCVGAMAIVGSLESGLSGNHKILFAKSMLDGISSIIFASSLGIGVLFSSLSVLVYQGVITLCASLLKGILVSTVITSMTAVGSLLIVGLGLNMLGVTKIKVANLLPAVFIPVIYQLILSIKI